jgi:hypothetical protein
MDRIKIMTSDDLQQNPAFVKNIKETYPEEGEQ